MDDKLSFPKSILAVCKANIQRSPTCEDYLKRKLTLRGYKVRSIYLPENYEIYISSAGIWTFHNEGRQLNRKMADNAQLILAMYADIEECLIKRFLQPKEKIINLDIPDKYKRGERNLIRQLDKKLLPVLDDWYPDRNKR